MAASQSRPFRLVGDSAIRAVREALVLAVSGWAREWGGFPALMEVTVRRAWENRSARVPDWNQSVQVGSLEAWLAISADAPGHVQHMLFSPDPASLPAGGAAAALAPAVARHAFDALVDALTRAALGGGQQPQRGTTAVPAHLWERGSGALTARVSVGRAYCEVLLNGAAVRALHEPTAALPLLAPVDPAASAAHAAVMLGVNAGHARVKLGTLLSLVPGDVIRLDRPADAPLALSTLSGKPLFDAYLGRSGTQLAVEVVALASIGAISHNSSGAVQ